MLSWRIVNSKTLYLIGLGYEPHFRILDKNFDKYKGQSSFWVYDKAKLDLAYFLANHSNKISQVTYLTSQNYETIQIHQKPQSQRTLQKDKILDFIHNYDFKIINTFTHPHPHNAYTLICKYMNTPPQQQMKKLFRLSFSEHPISFRGSFLPKMEQIRQTYLNTEGLKLRVLQRKRNATHEEVQLNTKAWKQHYQIDETLKSLIQTSQNEEQIKKQNWIAENNYGWEVEKKYVLEGFGRNFSSFSFA